MADEFTPDAPHLYALLRKWQRRAETTADDHWTAQRMTYAYGAAELEVALTLDHLLADWPPR